MMRGMANLAISCDDCSLRHSTACRDCLVHHVLAADPTVDELVDEIELVDALHHGLELDDDQERVVALFAKAGMVPGLRHVAS